MIPLATLALMACEKPVTDADGDGSVSMTFRIVTPSESRAQSAADFRTLVIADVQNGAVRQMLRRERTDGDFSSPTLQLTPGTHTLRFLATDAESTAVDGAAVRWQRTGDTFMRSVEVSATDGTSQTVILNRIVAKVLWQGDGQLTIGGLPVGIDLATAQPLSETTTATLAHGGECYSLVPKSGIVTLDNGNQVAVEASTVTRIMNRNGDGGHDPIPGGTDQNPDEYLALTTDTALIYVSNRETDNIALADVPDPAKTYAMQLSPYRMPTRLEASELRKVTLPADYWKSGLRALCYDDPAHSSVKIGGTQYGTGAYYTFLWGSGSVSKAGTKTKYTITPVRSQPLAPIGTPFTITVDFDWSGDTIVVN